MLGKSSTMTMLANISSNAGSEPCLRGHRSTSCQHTDRVLVEVRKPGRPMQTCGHNLSSCFCGKLADSFTLQGMHASRCLYIILKSSSLQQEPHLALYHRTLFKTSKNQHGEDSKAESQPSKGNEPNCETEHGQGQQEIFFVSTSSVKCRHRARYR